MFSTNTIKALAFVSAVSAVQLTNSNFAIQASKPFDITWSGNTAPVTIYLESGDPTNLHTVNTIVSGATGNSFTWIPSASLPNAMYALAIEDDGQTDVNYSPEFQFVGGVDGVPTTAATSTAPMTSTASASTTESTSTGEHTSTASSSLSSAASVPLSSESLISDKSASTEVPVMTSNLTMTRSSSSSSATATSTATGSETTSTGIASMTAAKATQTGNISQTGTSDSVSNFGSPAAFMIFASAVLAFLFF